MIPKSEYIKCDGCTVITGAMFRRHHTAAEWRRFARWMNGQTMLMMPDQSAGIYVDDYERWLAGLPVID